NVEKSFKKLNFSDYERPMGIQIVGNNIQELVQAAKMAESVQPDLIDINFGCPVKKVAMKGSGAGLLKDVPLMVRMTAAVVKSVQLPVTVKTRLGWDDTSKEIVVVAEKLQDVGIAAITIHGRTRAQMYKGTADWTLIGAVKNNPRMTIPVIGNGDIDSAQKAVDYYRRYGVDGIMIGRAAVGNPWIFRETKHFYATGTQLPPPSLNERIAVCYEHLLNAIVWKGEKIGIFEMRKHYSNYFKGIAGIKAYRKKLVEAVSLEAIEQHLLSMLDEKATDEK
ncbi:MAG: tRNA-dihydrouridine synthase, partial [Bacteroidales bacterium]|nr:tRNA-dihydrouridine synthase [Bacteroidales bacterium]